MADTKDLKKLELAEYRVKQAEAELNAVKNSKAYRVSKLFGHINKQIKADPIGLAKKVTRIAISDPKRLRHILRSANRGSFIAQSIDEQNAKYREWILINEPDELELDEQRRISDKFKYQPIISVLTPVFNPPISVLEDLIESVLDQTYPYFELCFGNFGDNKGVKELIEKYTKLDPRIKNYKFSENRGIAGNSNLILENVTGDYIALLDHDDTLSPDALYENVRLLNDKPYDFIYSDKDKIDDQGNRFSPLFKPELSPEMLLNINYLTHLNLMRTSLVREIGGWDPNTDGAQDWDIFLRIIESARLVAHIPKVLYHWRVISSSTAMSIDTKPYALTGQQKAIDKYLNNENIQAVSYHHKTELLLKWSNKTIDHNPIVFISYSDLHNTIRTIRHVGRSVSNPRFVILLEDVNDDIAKLVTSKIKYDILRYDYSSFSKAIGGYINKINTSNDHTVLFIIDEVSLPKNVDWYEDLTGWLTIKDVGAVSGRLINKNDLIVSSGGIIAENNSYYPLFHKYPRYYESYIGNAEWVRNLNIISSIFCATKLSLLQSFDFLTHRVNMTKQEAFDEYFLSLSVKYRLVMTPHSTGTIFNNDNIDSTRPVESLNLNRVIYKDKYNNTNMSTRDPMNLLTNKPLGLDVSAIEIDPISIYQRDATILANTYDMTEQELVANSKQVSTNRPIYNPRSVAWFIPSFDVLYAGLMNIFSFASFLVTSKNLKTTFYILKGSDDVSQERELISKSFHFLKTATFIAIRPNDITQIKPHDIGLATQWATAYPLAKTSLIIRKCYFIQDNEVNFYPKGSISALVDLSYRFGFMAIAGTDGLLEMYKEQYGGLGVALKSRIDLEVYYPNKVLSYKATKPYKIFFYARPNMPRNAFELGIAGLKKLKDELGQEVEIITAGSSWNPSDYGVEGIFTNLGKISYGLVPKLYRTIDVGLMFMFSGHPGVTASELMASGCPVVVNEYNDITWHELYKNEETCLLTKPTASEIARNLKRCLLDTQLRKKLIDNGLRECANFYRGYEESLEKAYGKIIE